MNPFSFELFSVPTESFMDGSSILNHDLKKNKTKQKQNKQKILSSTNRFCKIFKSPSWVSMFVPTPLIRDVLSMIITHLFHSCLGSI